MGKLDVNKTAFWVTLIFILVSPIENILRTEQIVYALGIAVLVLCIVQRKYLLINNSKYIIALMIYMFLTCYWSAERQAFNSLFVSYAELLFIFATAVFIHRKSVWEDKSCIPDTKLDPSYFVFHKWKLYGQ